MPDPKPVVMITGASSGIGAALAGVYAAQGARLVLLARRLERLQQLSQDLQKEHACPEPLLCMTDVRNESDLQKATEAAVQSFGGLDVVIANAGFAVGGKFEKLTNEDFSRQLDTNLFGLLNTVRWTLPQLKKSKGRLALLGSVAGHLSLPGYSPYSISKFAVRALADSITYEFLPHQVSVTLISPGFIRSEIRKVDNLGVLQQSRKDPAPAWIQMDAGKAARQMMRAIKSRRREIVVTGHGKWMVFLSRYLPWVVRIPLWFHWKKR